MSFFLKIKSFFVFLLFIAWSGSLCFASAPHSSWSFRALELIPVQNGGRIKPLDSFAREIVLYETGSRKYEGWNSVDLLLSWISSPQYWHKKLFIRVSREDVRRQLGLDEKRSHFSPEELFNNPALLQYAAKIGNGVQASEPPGAPQANPREQELKAVLDRLSVFQNLVTGQAWLLVPQPSPSPWSSVIDQDRNGELIRSQFLNVVQAYSSDLQSQFEQSSFLLRAAVEGEIPQYQGYLKNSVAAEVFYNQVRPFMLAWVFYLFSVLSWMSFAAFRNEKTKRRLKNFANGFLGMGFFLSFPVQY